MPRSLGFWYERDGYDISGKRLMGRQAAGLGFLQALLRHASAERLYCVTHDRESFEDCTARAAAWGIDRPLSGLPTFEPGRITEAGLLYKPDAGLADLAWMRRHGDQRGYSICGVTHTISTRATMQQIGDLPIAPLQDWDALICTSQAVKTVVERTLAQWSDYLASRFGRAASQPLQLPVIPLGIDTSAFAPDESTALHRADLRTRLDIAENDLLVLYVGRLNFYEKAHPVPMFQAVQRASATLATRGQAGGGAPGQKLHLLCTGWFEREREEKAFREAASNFCPDVPCHFLDGRDAALRRQSWAAADLFVSLSDNIQESFGLTPLEAMAAGLPVICTDWDGYRETVRHEVDGFRVPVTLPPAGSGEDLARDYLSGRTPWSGRACQSTAADIEAVAHALVTLAEQPALRHAMGAAGRERAQSEFDWRHILQRYEQLWDELAQRRTQAPECAARVPGTPAFPLCDDPFRVFAGYSHRHLRADMTVSLSPAIGPREVDLLLDDWMVSYGGDRRLAAQDSRQLLDLLKDVGPIRISELLRRHMGREQQVYRTIGWLLKFDIVRI